MTTKALQPSSSRTLQKEERQKKFGKKKYDLKKEENRKMFMSCDGWLSADRKFSQKKIIDVLYIILCA